MSRGVVREGCDTGVGNQDAAHRDANRSGKSRGHSRAGR